MNDTRPTDPMLDISVLAPAHNEQDNVIPLAEAVERAIAPLDRSWEMLIIDDGSTDATSAKLAEALPRFGFLRVYRVTNAPPGRGLGLTAAFDAGVRRCRGRIICTLDADLQNDPADLPAMIERLESQSLDLVQGDRSANRHDNFIRRMSSNIGRAFRGWVLGDRVKDTACSLRVMRREVALDMPFQFKGMHRFVPFYAKMRGFGVESFACRHHRRVAGEAKFGIWNRALPGLIDLFAVRWMASRHRRPEVEEQHHNPLPLQGRAGEGSNRRDQRDAAPSPILLPQREGRSDRTSGDDEP